MPMIGQALYTWSTETLSGTTGFGFVSASPSLAPRIPWLHSISKTLTRYEPLAAGARSDPLGFDAVLPVRSVVDDTAVVAFKAYQGDDKFHRPGRYSVQFFVAESAALPLSTVFRLRAALVLQPSTLRLDESPSLDDLDIESPGLLDAYDASGERAAQLIAALRSTNWTHLDVGAAELPAVVDAMSVLHPAWDACATLQLLSVRPSLLWRLALRAPVAVGDHRTAANRVLALESGDEKWKTLRSSLANATTADQLTLSWDLLQRKDDTVIPAVSASAGTNSITDAVREYVGGNGARLKRLMDAQPEGGSGLQEVVLADLVKHGWRMVVRDMESETISVALLRVYEGAWGSRNKMLADILPASAGEIAALAHRELTPKLFRTIVARNGAPELDQTVALYFPSVRDGMWGVVHTLWSNPETREGLVATFRLSGVAEGSLIAALLALPKQSIPFPFVFGELLPALFSSAGGLRVVADNFTEFKEWANVPDYYWQMFRFDRSVIRFWRRGRR